MENNLLQQIVYLFFEHNLMHVQRHLYIRCDSDDSSQPTEKMGN